MSLDWFQNLPWKRRFPVGRFSGLAALWIVLVGLRTVCAADDRVLRIGLLLPPEEPESAGIREGVLLAKADANKRANQRVEVIIRGRAGQWGADGVEAARMVTDDGVEGLISPPDGAASHLTLQVSGRTAVPVVSLCPDSSIERTGVPWLLRVVPSTTDEAKALFAHFIRKNGSSTNFVNLVVPDGRAGRELSHDLRRAAHDCGIEIRSVLEINLSLTNAVSVQAKVVANHPYVILVWLPSVPAGTIARNLRSSGYSGQLAGPALLQSPDFVATAGEALENFLVCQPARNNEAANRWTGFLESYRQSYHREPSATAAMSYDAASLLFYLLQQPDFQVPPHHVSPKLFWPGVTGDLRFDSTGNRKWEAQILRGHGGRFISLN